MDIDKIRNIARGLAWIFIGGFLILGISQARAADLPLDQIRENNADIHKKHTDDEKQWRKNLPKEYLDKNGMKLIIPQKKAAIEECMWEGRMAYWIQVARQIEHDDFETYKKKITNWYSDIPSLRDSIIAIGSDLYAWIEEEISPQDVGTAWIYACFEHGSVMSRYEIPLNLDGRHHL